MYDDANRELATPARAKYARDHVRQYKRLVLSAPKWMLDANKEKRQTKRRKTVKAHA